MCDDNHDDDDGENERKMRKNTVKIFLLYAVSGKLDDLLMKGVKTGYEIKNDEEKAYIK